MLPLRIYGTTSRLACSRQLGRCVAQLGPTIGVLKPGDGKSMWKRPLLSSGKLSRPGRLVMASGHHTMLPNTLPDMHHAREEADKKIYENIDPKSSKVYCLANQFRREKADVVDDKPVKNDAGEMSVSEDSKQKVWSEHYQRPLYIEFNWDPDHPSDKPRGRPAHPNHH